MRSRSETFKNLFKDSYWILVRYVFLRVNNSALAEDLAAEAFAIAWEKSLPLEAITLGWLFATARNLIGNEFQRRDRERSRIQMIAIAELGKAKPWEAQIENADLAVAISRLPPVDALVLRMTYWDGLTAAQAAQVIGCSTPALWVRLTRIRAALRAMLDPPEAIWYVLHTQRGDRC